MIIVLNVEDSRLTALTAKGIEALPVRINSALNSILADMSTTKTGPVHASDCAQHNEPAYPNGPCDCGAVKGGSTEPWHHKIKDLVSTYGCTPYLRDELVLLGELGVTKECAIRLVFRKEGTFPLPPDFMTEFSNG